MENQDHMAINIKNPDDIRQMIGWHIADVTMGVEKGSPLLALQLTHIAAESDYVIKIVTGLDVMVNPNMIKFSKTLTVHSIRIKKEGSKGEHSG